MWDSFCLCVACWSEYKNASYFMWTSICWVIFCGLQSLLGPLCMPCWGWLWLYGLFSGWFYLFCFALVSVGFFKAIDVSHQLGQRVGVQVVCVNARWMIVFLTFCLPGLFRFLYGRFVVAIMTFPFLRHISQKSLFEWPLFELQLFLFATVILFLIPVCRIVLLLHL